MTISTSQLVLQRSIIALTLIVGVVSANAVVVFDNFADDNSYDISRGNTIGAGGGPPAPTTEYGVSFTVGTASLLLDEVQLAVSLAFGANTFSFRLMTSAAGLPDTTIDERTLTGTMGQFGLNNAPISITYNNHPMLNAGQQYWFTATAPGLTTSAAWNQSTVAQTVMQASRTDNGSWHLVAGTPGAFRIIATAVPEPSAAVMFSSAIFALWLVSRISSGRRSVLPQQPNDYA